jgi:hypothetical protein
LGRAKGNEMHIYWKNLYLFAKVTQVSDVANGSLFVRNFGFKAKIVHLESGPLFENQK